MDGWKENRKGEGRGKKEVDWRKAGVVHSVIDQQECECCWAICVLASIEAIYKIENKDDELIKLSIQELVNCVLRTESECYPYRIQKAFRWVIDNGVSLEENYGVFSAKKKPCWKRKHPSMAIQISDFTTVEVEDETALLEAVAQQPVVFELRICQDFKDYKRGIYWGPRPDSKGITQHGLLIVGYGTDENGVNYWLGKNSYGESWGERGYVRVVRKSSMHGQPSFIFTAAYPVI